jgi:pimeloyl-ACP methyl ester carboxylesterase
LTVNFSASERTSATDNAVLESKYVTLPGGIRAHYQEAGPAEAPALILTHGFLGSVSHWRLNTKAIADLAVTNPKFQPRRVIAVDWVGFGKSDKPAVHYSLRYFAEFLKAFADALGLKQFDLGGHSMGGKHNLAFTIYFPEYVRKLVLVDTDGFVKDPWWTNITDTWYFKPLANYSTVLLGKPSFLKATLLKSVFYDPKFYPTESEIEEAAQELRDPLYMASLRALNRDYPDLSLRLTGLFDRLGELKQPALLFWGQQDRILHVSMAKIAQEKIPNSTLHIFDHCGHMLQVEKSAEFNRLVLEFLKTE